MIFKSQANNILKESSCSACRVMETIIGAASALQLQDVLRSCSRRSAQLLKGLKKQERTKLQHQADISESVN